MILFLFNNNLKNYRMKKFLFLSLLLAGSACAICQSGTDFSADADKAFGLKETEHSKTDMNT